VTTAASVAKYATDQGYSFGLVSNAMAAYSGKWLSVPFGSSLQQLGLALETLAMAGPYTVISLAQVLHTERDSLPPGATLVLVTSVVTTSLAHEVSEIRARGYKIIVLYTGDYAPEIALTSVTVHHVGRALAALEYD
jgi:uncharacterized protein (DUF58 family)